MGCKENIFANANFLLHFSEFYVTLMINRETERRRNKYGNLL